MKVKPKELMVNLPIVIMFDTYDEIAAFASTINTIIYGKLRVKYEELGILSKKYVGLFYIHRNNEYQTLREEFVSLIDREQMEEHTNSK